jgi:dolichol-phosphate mannosyltransferase
MIMMSVESHPPELIPIMVQAFIDGAKVVQCIRDTLSGRPFYRDIGTALFSPLIRILTGFDFREQNVYFRLISRDFTESLLSSPRYWRFLRFPLPEDGSGAIRKIHVDMSERTSGDSKYYLGRLLGFAIDGILVCISGPRMIALNLAFIGLAALLLRLNLPFLALIIVAAVSVLSYRFYTLRTDNQVEKLIVEETNRDSF